jgi:hypothetical protein
MLQDVVGHEVQGRLLVNNLDHHRMVLHIYMHRRFEADYHTD